LWVEGVKVTHEVVGSRVKVTHEVVGSRGQGHKRGCGFKGSRSHTRFWVQGVKVTHEVVGSSGQGHTQASGEGILVYGFAIEYHLV